MMRLPFLRRPPALPTRHLIVGLGNPGAEYHGTRHNVGFRVIDLLAERHRIDIRKIEKRAHVGYGTVEETTIALAKPLTYMNLSGESVAPLLQQLNLKPEDVLIITDDMDLPVGKLRLRREGSPGGHNGLKSLVHFLRTQEFPRLRIGVGRPSAGTQVIDHVLSKFDRADLEPIQEAIEKAADCVEYVITAGVDAAMNRYNTK